MLLNFVAELYSRMDALQCEVMNVVAGAVQQVEDVDGLRIQSEFSRFLKEWVLASILISFLRYINYFPKLCQQIGSNKLWNALVIRKRMKLIFLWLLVPPFRFTDENGVRIYDNAISALIEPERNTLYVDMRHIHSYSATLYGTIELQFYKLYPYVCEALQLAVIDSCSEDADRHRMHKKEVYVSFAGLENRVNVRELTAEKIGAMVCINGQVVRTHPVHPELSRATFICEDCGVTTRNVLQQFRYTQVQILYLLALTVLFEDDLPTRCTNPQCMNRNRFSLDVDDSSFVDFQKIRIQETQAELPRGSVPRTFDVIVRGEMVESVQPGDRCSLTGTLIVIPDISQLSSPVTFSGLRAEAGGDNRGRASERDAGLTGLKALGVRDLNYKLAFLACHIESNNTKFGGKDFSHENIDHLRLWKQMSNQEHAVLKTMSEDKRISENLVESLFPNIYGNDEVKLGVLLMLFGGVAKKSKSDGTTLRGDINVCLVGDPSTAKSQIL
ncbi:unnamed protein product, partial [Strongylus vulgaris]